MKTPAVILAIGIATGAANIAVAQTASDLNNQVTTMNNTTANQGQTNVINKISSDFSSFLGTDSKAVVTGLRNGTPITLTSTTTTPSGVQGGVPVTTTTTTMITPPTGHMGFGNVYISLALAKTAAEQPRYHSADPRAVTGCLNRRHHYPDDRHGHNRHDHHDKFTRHSHHAQPEHGLGTDCAKTWRQARASHCRDEERQSAFGEHGDNADNHGENE